MDKLVKFNAQTNGREKLIRLCQYTAKFVNSILQLYYSKYAKGGNDLLEFIFKLRDLEQYFLSCRRVISFGRCTDHLYSAFKSIRLYDPVARTTLSISKLATSFQLFADHVILLQQVGLLKVDKTKWSERSSTFWLYSVTMNLLRDFYELICVVQTNRLNNISDINNNHDSNAKDYKFKFTMKTPFEWAKRYPRLSCDFVKNFCDFWIPYTTVNHIKVHPSILATLGIVSSAMSILQIYDKSYRFSPS